MRLCLSCSMLWGFFSWRCGRHTTTICTNRHHQQQQFVQTGTINNNNLYKLAPSTTTICTNWHHQHVVQTGTINNLCKPTPSTTICTNWHHQQQQFVQTNTINNNNLYKPATSTHEHFSCYHHTSKLKAARQSVAVQIVQHKQRIYCICRYYTPLHNLAQPLVSGRRTIQTQTTQIIVIPHRASNKK